MLRIFAFTSDKLLNPLDLVPLLPCAHLLSLSTPTKLTFLLFLICVLAHYKNFLLCIKYYSLFQLYSSSWNVWLFLIIQAKSCHLIIQAIHSGHIQVLAHISSMEISFLITESKTKQNRKNNNKTKSNLWNLGREKCR